ncbi:hypothetical protein [Shimazuella kribbensis]|uniref:hypothetical protein n=1 Tax=Shimazuella kribbensis TaxID=139808 RepID=UPI000423D3A2|nr:hypothetical protein [Shimazuella kribbensis]
MEDKNEEQVVMTNETTHCKSTYRYRRSSEKERKKNRERLAKEIAKIVLGM